MQRFCTHVYNYLKAYWFIRESFPTAGSASVSWLTAEWWRMFPEIQCPRGVWTTGQSKCAFRKVWTHGTLKDICRRLKSSTFHYTGGSWNRMPSFSISWRVNQWAFPHHFCYNLGKYIHPLNAGLWQSCSCSNSALQEGALLTGGRSLLTGLCAVCTFSHSKVRNLI